MNIHELREAQVRYEKRIEEVLKSREDSYKIQEEFARYFNRKRIQDMQIDEYVLGVERLKNGSNFCYTLERELDKLGRIVGATSFKFGVYYGRTKEDDKYKYRFAKKFGDTYQEAFKNVKNEILQLLLDGENENLKGIAENSLSPMFKGKIISTYFPERYLNIFSDDHLNHYLVRLDLDNKELSSSNPVYKREALVEFKNQDPIMKNWTMDLFSTFLYTEYPGQPFRDDRETADKDVLTEYRQPQFSPSPTPEFIELDILPPNSTSLPNSHTSKETSKTDYEKENRINKKLGDRGEKIVLDIEKTRLIKAGKKNLADKIERISLRSDSLGYDILSFDEDGTKRYIEVKATRSKKGIANFFFTANELRTAQETENYFIYMVYEVTTESPKVWIIKNPFRPDNKNTVMAPINYRITINAK